MAKWTTDNIPSMQGKVVVVTGANSGIGFEAVKVFVQKGAHVVMAARNMTKAQKAHDAVLLLGGRGSAEIIHLDLADLKSVRTFADTFRQAHIKLDVLVNNAGVMMLPFMQTKDGFEMQIGTNHLGHFALTSMLMSPLLASDHSRIVTVSSLMHLTGDVNLLDLNWEQRDYNKSQAYADSKLANLLFTYELQRRLTAKGENTLAVACHPGYASTQLQGAGARIEGKRTSLAAVNIGNVLFAQSAEKGALPTLMAATDPAASGGDYYGPRGRVRGFPKKAKSNAKSHDVATAKALWELSEKLTGTQYALV